MKNRFKKSILFTTLMTTMYCQESVLALPSDDSVSKFGNIVDDSAATQRQRDNALFEAIGESNLKAVRERIDAGANVNGRSTIICDSALDFAVHVGNIEIVRILIEQAKKDDETEITKMLNAWNRFNQTPLNQAAAKGYAQIVQMLIDEGADINAVSFNGTPLVEAQQNGHAETVEMLLDAGADIQVESKALIHAAATMGNCALVEMLITKDATSVDLEYDDEKNTLLHCAAREGHLEVAEELIEVSDNLNHGLYVALGKSKREVIQLLIEARVDVNANSDGAPIFWKAIKPGALDIIKMLIKAGADIKQTDKDNRNCLHRAAGIRCSKTKICQFLIETYPSECAEFINAQDKYGNTPLHVAGKEGCDDVFDLLVQNGARLDIENNKKHKPVKCVPCSHAHGCSKVMLW